jgi:CRP-like cAMP-binding protein
LSKLFKKVTRAYAAGEIVFVQGAAADGIYSVQSGKVSVFKTVPGPDGPREIELVRLGPGSMFGEMAMLGQTQRDASVRALEFTEVLVITKEMFESQMASLPPWVVNFVKILVNRLRSTNDRLTAAMRLLEANGFKLPDDKPGPASPGPASPGDPPKPPGG